jgi:hypothetical protein
MCIEEFKRESLLSSLVSVNENISLENALLISHALSNNLDTVVLKPNACSCSYCPIFKPLYLSLTGVPHVDKFGEYFICNTTLSNCINSLTNIRWLPLVCGNVVYTGLGTTELELCYPLNSYSELFSKAMNVDWEIFSECLMGPLLGFKKYFSFDRTGELLYVYNKTCKKFGLPKFHRTIRCKWKKKANLDIICEDLVNQVEELNDSEVMRLMVELSSYDDEVKGFVSLEGLPEVKPIEVFVNPTKEEGKAAKEEYKAVLKKAKKCIIEERRHRKKERYSTDPFEEPIEHLLNFVKDQIKRPDGVTWQLTNYGCIDPMKVKLIHIGEHEIGPGKILKSGKEGRPRKMYNNKRVCENMDNVWPAASVYRSSIPRSEETLEMMRQKAIESNKEDHELHDFSKMKVKVLKNKKFPLLKNFAEPTEVSIMKKPGRPKYEKIILPGKVFPMAKFYKFLRIKVHELLVRHEYSSYLRIGSGFDIKQIKPLRTDEFFSDTICQEIFWVDFSKKYGSKTKYQELLQEFNMFLGHEENEIDIEKSCRLFFNRMLKNVVNRNKRIRLSSLKEEEKSIMGYLLLACSSNIFNYRKELKITSGCLKSLIRARARLKI